MLLALQLSLLVVGFILLIKGANFLVAGAASLASHFRVSKMLIGLTVIAFGTSAPELAVSFSALNSGNTDLLLGNIVGSNILNILLLIGIAALIRPLKVKAATVRKEIPICLLVSTLLGVLFLDKDLFGAPANVITQGDATVILLFFGLFLFYLITLTRKRKTTRPTVSPPQHHLPKALSLVIVGLIGVALGSQLVVHSASDIATNMGLSERLIALTVLAIGGSLPELVTTIVASRKGEQDMIIGNIIGSNIFNICIVLGLPIVLFGAATQSSFQIVDFAVLLFSALLLFFFARKDYKISRPEAAFMLLIFALYYGFVICF